MVRATLRKLALESNFDPIVTLYSENRQLHEIFITSNVYGKIDAIKSHRTELIILHQ